MTALGVGIVGLALVLLVGWAFVSVDAASLVRLIRYSVGTLLILIGGVVGLGGRLGVGLFLAALGFSAITAGKIGPFDLGGGRRSRGSASIVRSTFLEMRLDHDTGTMRGRVLAGAEAGRDLDDLDEAGCCGSGKRSPATATAWRYSKVISTAGCPDGVNTSRVMRQRGRAARRMRAP